MKKVSISVMPDDYVSDILTFLKCLFKYAVKTLHIANPMDDVDLKREKYL